MTKVKRPRFRVRDLETILSALNCYIDSLNKQMDVHENDASRFKRESEWLKKRERLNWMLSCANSVKIRMELNLKGVHGRTPEPLKHLLHLTDRERLGEYIRFLKALPLLPGDDLEAAVNSLKNAVDRGIVSSFRDQDDDGLLKVRKLDVLRLAAYLEAHR